MKREEVPEQPTDPPEPTPEVEKVEPIAVLDWRTGRRVDSAYGLLDIATDAKIKCDDLWYELKLINQLVEMFTERVRHHVEDAGLLIELTGSGALRVYSPGTTHDQAAGITPAHPSEPG